MNFVSLTFYCFCWGKKCWNAPSHPHWWWYLWPFQFYKTLTDHHQELCPIFQQSEIRYHYFLCLHKSSLWHDANFNGNFKKNSSTINKLNVFVRQIQKQYITFLLGFYLKAFYVILWIMYVYVFHQMNLCLILLLN